MANYENKPILVLDVKNDVYVGKVNGAKPERRNYMIKFKSLNDLWSFANAYMKVTLTAFFNNHQATISCQDNKDEGDKDGASDVDSYCSIEESQNVFNMNALRAFKK